MATASPNRSEQFSFFTIVNLLALRESDQELADVPFDFMVGDRVHRSGQYSLEPSGIKGMVIVRRADSDSPPVLVQAISAGCRGAERPNSLLFYFQQDSYFLAQALIGSN
jgi:hypothetical protein